MVRCNFRCKNVRRFPLVVAVVSSWLCVWVFVCNVSWLLLLPFVSGHAVSIVVVVVVDDDSNGNNESVVVCPNSGVASLAPSLSWFPFCILILYCCGGGGECSSVIVKFCRYNIKFTTKWRSFDIYFCTLCIYIYALFWTKTVIAGETAGRFVRPVMILIIRIVSLR